MKNLKSLLFIFVITISMFIVSCNNEFDSQNPISDNEKVIMINELFESYGWEKDESVSDAERESLYRKTDYSQIKVMLEELKKDWRFETIKYGHNSETRGSNAYQHWYIEGVHYHYNNPDIGMIQTHIDMVYEPPLTSNTILTNSFIFGPATLIWIPNAHYTFPFYGEKCEISISGKILYHGYYYNKEMKGYVTKDINTGIMKGGLIYSFK